MLCIKKYFPKSRPNEIVKVVDLTSSRKTRLIKVIIGSVVPSAGHIKLKLVSQVFYFPHRLNFEHSLTLITNRFLNLVCRTGSENCIGSLENIGGPYILYSQLSEI